MQSVADHFNVSLTTIARTERAIKLNYEPASRYRAWLKEQPAQST